MMGGGERLSQSAVGGVSFHDLGGQRVSQSAVGGVSCPLMMGEERE